MKTANLAQDLETGLLESLHSTKLVSGLTHNFYRYPARMSPELAREIIERFSSPDDVVFDPFMGGGTSLVEALATGRRTIGIDLNPLATLVTSVKTTPLSRNDRLTIEPWARQLGLSDDSHATSAANDPVIRNWSLDKPDESGSG